MIKNYLKIAWRNLQKNKLYSFINIGGLAIGMAVSFMLLLYVYNEFSFDKFNVNSARLYQVYMNQKNNDVINTGITSPVPLAGVLQKDIPEIEKITRTGWPEDILVNYRDKAIKLKTLKADVTLLDMFSFDFVYGNKSSALSDVSSIVLTQSGAKAIFGDINPVGRVIKFDAKYPLKVSAVIKDNPGNSTFAFSG